MPVDNVRINSLNYDGSLKRGWPCRFIGQSGSMLEFLGRFTNEISHPELGLIAAGTISYEYYWLDKNYNIFRFHEPDGRLRNWYCNINLPPKFENDVLDYVDLDVDVIVWPDMSYKVVDLEDFERNAVRFDYPPEITDIMNDARTTLESMIASRDFPFDHVDAAYLTA